MSHECATCGASITLCYSATEPWDWDEHFRVRWVSGPDDDRTKVIENEYGTQKFPNYGEWRFCSAECLAEFDFGGVA